MAKARPVSNEDPQLKRLRAHGNQLALSKRHDLAEPIWRDLLAKLPRDPGLHRQLANCLLNLRRIDEAFEESQTAVTLNPASHESLSMLGLMHRIHGRYEQATVAHRQALELKPDYLPALLGMALDHQVQLQWPEALNWANRGLALKPDHVELLRIRGKALAITGQHDDARAALDEFLRLAPDESESHRAAAIILRRLDRVAEATEFAERAMTLNPADPDLHNTLAWAKIKERKFEEAERHLESAAELYDSRRDGQKGSKFTQVQTLAGQTVLNVKRRKLAAAEEQYRRMLEITPERQVVRALLAAVVGSQNRFDEALMLAREAVERETESDVPLRVLIVLLAEVERFDESIAVANGAIERHPDSAELYRACAAMYLSQENYPKAFETIETAMTLKPSPAIRRVLAVAFAGVGRSSEALAAIEANLQEECDTFSSESAAGYSYYLLGDYSRAESHLLRAMSLDESGLGGHGWLGLVYAAQGRTNEARSMIARALELNPHQWRMRAELEKLGPS